MAGISERTAKKIHKAAARKASKLSRQGKLRATKKYKTKKEAQNAYIYGAKRKAGWKPS